VSSWGGGKKKIGGGTNTTARLSEISELKDRARGRFWKASPHEKNLKKDTGTKKEHKEDPKHRKNGDGSVGGT